LDFARFQHIPTMETIDIIRSLVAGYDITAAQGMSVMSAMADAGRAVYQPKSPRELAG